MFGGTFRVRDISPQYQRYFTIARNLCYGKKVYKALRLATSFKLKKRTPLLERSLILNYSAFVSSALGASAAGAAGAAGAGAGAASAGLGAGAPVSTCLGHFIAQSPQFLHNE